MPEKPEFSADASVNVNASFGDAPNPSDYESRLKAEMDKLKPKPPAAPDLRGEADARFAAGKRQALDKIPGKPDLSVEVNARVSAGTQQVTGAAGVSGPLGSDPRSAVDSRLEAARPQALGGAPGQRGRDLGLKLEDSNSHPGLLDGSNADRYVEDRGPKDLGLELEESNSHPGLLDGSNADRYVDGGPPKDVVTDDETIGAGEYTVKQGDCLASIAEDAGLLWQKIWDHPENADVRELRDDPNVLLPGDQLTIPEKTVKHEPGATEMRHRFKRKGQPAFLRLRMLDDEDQPRGNEPFTLKIEGHDEINGTTSADGLIECPIPPTAKEGSLTVGDGTSMTTQELALGDLNPVDTKSGAHGRLTNLGYLDAQQADDESFERAVSAFQTQQGLEPSGVLDAETRAQLEQTHGV